MLSLLGENIPLQEETKYEFSHYDNDHMQMFFQEFTEIFAGDFREKKLQFL